MKHLKIPFLLSIAVFAACSAVVGSGCKKPDPKTQARNEIQKLYDAQNAALERKDVDGFLAYHAPDYMTINARGKTQDLASERKDTTLMFSESPITNNHFATTIHAVTLEGSGGTQATVTEARLGKGTISVAGKTGDMALTMEARDFWLKGASGWQLKRQKILSMRATMNGKPLGRH